MNFRLPHRAIPGVVASSLAIGLMLLPRPLLAHSGHAHDTGNQSAQEAVDTQQPSAAPGESSEAEATVPEHENQPAHNTSATSEDPDAEQAPASEPRQTDRPTTAGSTEQQNFRSLIGPGEIIFALLVAGPFLLLALRQQVKQ